MQTFTPAFSAGRPARLLLLGAHSDDIEIGCGGTVLRMLAERPTDVCWVVFSASGDRAREARGSAQDFLVGAARADIRTLEFPDAYFPSCSADIKRAFETLKAFEPDTIFTHAGHDLHQDHRLLCELTWNTWRDHIILEYEIAKYDADLRSPNFFVPLSPHQCRHKCELLVRHFATQRSKHWFDAELFMGLMRLRGMECRSPTAYAEGFYARKIVI